MTERWQLALENPTAVLGERMARLAKLRAAPGIWPAIRTHYKNGNIADFIDDWGVTYDPRLAGSGRPPLQPMVLFPRQRDLVNWLWQRWQLKEDGAVPKSREVGASWVCVAFGCGLAVLFDGVTVGYGSRKEEYVDLVGDPKSLFGKARLFLGHLPAELRGGWDVKVHAPHMRVTIPGTGSLLTGEAGDNIGRGNRTSIYFVDEAAWLVRPMLVEAALSETTDCRVDVSSVHGLSNPFADKCHRWPAERVFRLHWRDDPRKDDAWYAQRRADLPAVVVAQEIDIDFSASAEGVLIPSAWVQSAVGAAAKLGIAVRGAMRCALDVADEGQDTCAWACARGIELIGLEEWSGRGSDMVHSATRAAELTLGVGAREITYDADGIGAGLKGIGRVVNEARGRDRSIRFEPHRGSAGVERPEHEDVPGRKNADFFLNAKAQRWWTLRERFELTHRAVAEGGAFDQERIVSIRPDLPNLGRLLMQLSQPTYSLTQSGKLVVDKAPEGASSPDLADAVSMVLGLVPRRMHVTRAAVSRFSAPAPTAMHSVATAPVGSPRAAGRALVARFAAGGRR
jgi:phage terminase large subunit